MSYISIEQILVDCEREKINFWKAIQLSDIKDRNTNERESHKKVEELWAAMKQASSQYDKNLKSNSGLVGGDGGKMETYKNQQSTICGEYISEVISIALQMGESNACMKRIVAAPTAGSCGVLPAVLIPYFNKNNQLEDKIIESLYVAAGIGQVIGERAYIAGASGGCQAEIGSASAMAAGAMVYLKNGTNKMISNACAMALKNLLGLVCDPVAGLVEVPCVKRNVMGAVNALSCADMALAGIESRIPADEVFDAMKEIGDSMHSDYKETSKGGIANTKTARRTEENC